MYKKLYYCFDENDKSIYGNPRLIEAQDVDAIGFTLQSSDFRGYPEVQIRRVLSDDISNDRWNDDGRPPTVLGSIINPHIEFHERGITLIGIESPNLIVAGLILEPYNTLSNGIRNIRNSRKPDFYNFSNLHSQRIVLTF